ncbi:hypothetical protein ACOMHN_045539 [Nucella lapillus]
MGTRHRRGPAHQNWPGFPLRTSRAAGTHRGPPNPGTVSRRRNQSCMRPSAGRGKRVMPPRGLRHAMCCRVTGGVSPKRPFPSGRMLGHGPGLGGFTEREPSREGST